MSNLKLNTTKSLENRLSATTLGKEPDEVDVEVSMRMSNDYEEAIKKESTNLGNLGNGLSETTVRENDMEMSTNDEVDREMSMRMSNDSEEAIKTGSTNSGMGNMNSFDPFLPS